MFFKLLYGDVGLLIADMPNEEVEKVSSLSRSPLFYKATVKDLCCIHLSLGFPVSSKFFFWLLSQLI